LEVAALKHRLHLLTMGYIISYLTYAESGESEAVILDARDISAGPICRLKIPERVPVGFHACWVSSDKAVGL
jgi:carotenoid cleavage dioxygenase-like enzyme